MKKYIDYRITSFTHAKVGISHDSLTETQTSCLSRLPLKYAFACLQMFVRWIEEGFYNFRHLPLVVKATMLNEDELFLKFQLQNHWCSNGELLHEIKTMLKILRQNEGYILKQKSQVRDT